MESLSGLSFIPGALRQFLITVDSLSNPATLWDQSECPDLDSLYSGHPWDQSKCPDKRGGLISGVKIQESFPKVLATSAIIQA